MALDLLVNVLEAFLSSNAQNLENPDQWIDSEQIAAGYSAMLTREEEKKWWQESGFLELCGL